MGAFLCLFQKRWKRRGSRARRAKGGQAKEISGRVHTCAQITKNYKSYKDFIHIVVHESVNAVLV